MKLLDTYWHKRNFKVTPEPRGKIINSKKELSYFIQRHHARSLHYDFRLELNGTLKSWAVPKGPSLDPADKRLAVHVEDHPLAYGTFEGVIPPKQYGAGEVVLWDQGVWVPLDDPAEGYRKGRLKFELKGEKLAGKWALVRMGKPSDKENWLLIKEKDEEARSGDTAYITELRPESVKGLKKVKSAKIETTTTLTLAILPLKLNPQLATLVKSAPEGDEWLSEIKYDGYRALTRIKHGKAVIYTRNGNDWTAHWPELAKKLNKLPIDEAWLDGEVVAFKDRTINFAALQNYEGDDSHIELKYFVFDVVFLNGQDISHLPLIHRKSLLKELLSSQDVNSPILYSEHIVGNAEKVFKASCQKGMEGIVIKRADSPYYQTRTNNWLKLKCIQRQEFVIGGYTDPAGSREGFGALLLGYYDQNGDFIYAGRVGTGFDDKTLTTLSKSLASLATIKSPYKVSPKKRDAIGIHWLKPVLIAEVNFAEWTSDGVIRHSSFVGLRSDKLPKKIVREVPVRTEEIQISSEALSTLHKTTPIPIPSSIDETVAGIKISHPDRMIFSDEQITKFDLAQYYQSVEKWILPHLTGRPLSLLRCPDGTEKECFFQKHLNAFYIKQIETIEISGHDTGKYIVVNDLPALISLVQMGVVELHTWGSRIPRLHKPDRIIFDLDPDPKLPWAKVMEGATLTKYFLDNIGLQSFLKTTGGKGLHIVVPIKPEFDFSEIKAFSRAIAVHLADTVPTHFTANMSKVKRLDKIYVDYLRNGEEATAISAYSVRARPGAPISVPLSWEELKHDMRSNSFNVKNIQDRLLRLTSDPWEGYFDNKQRVTSAMRKIFR